MFSGRRRGSGTDRPGGGDALSFIGAETSVAGDIVTGSHLHIDGKVQGDIRCAMLVQGASGTIIGAIQAEEARLAGLVDGTVTAAILILDASARITGDVRYQSLSIATGAEVEGRFSRRPGGEEIEAGPARKPRAPRARPALSPPVPELFPGEERQAAE